MKEFTIFLNAVINNLGCLGGLIALIIFYLNHRPKKILVFLVILCAISNGILEVAKLYVN